MAVLGQYDIRVQKGAVSLMGAILHAGSTAYRVHAPSTHALPVIRCVPDPFSSTNRQTKIELTAYDNGLHLLRQVSTRFGGIWNDDRTRIDGPTPAAQDKARSFTPVRCIPCMLVILTALTTMEDIRNISELPRESFTSFTRIRTLGISTFEIYRH